MVAPSGVAAFLHNAAELKVWQTRRCAPRQWPQQRREAFNVIKLNSRPRCIQGTSDDGTKCGCSISAQCCRTASVANKALRTSTMAAAKTRSMPRFSKKIHVPDASKEQAMVAVAKRLWSAEGASAHCRSWVSHFIPQNPQRSARIS